MELFKALNYLKSRELAWWWGIASVCGYLQWAYFFASFKGSLAGCSTLVVSYCLSGLKVLHPMFSWC